ncbi:histidine kinase [Scytonema hofmannii PCC 7110]|uniref:Circadian input-output histidine kinase CikA n=1 Tax=Scytonema hofmannii PCC 7110 TaxID=128403 RepID=A0A139XEE1_9CYAN|nr:response regulator [Scytonema hofmannii]KYC43055.1 histidine kinase [Scytonema hofmannii PCC 7110]
MDIINFVNTQEVDLTNCDREAIHIPGSIQPHGLLLVLQEPELKILQVSHNIANFFQIPAESLINQNLPILFPPAQIEILKNCISQAEAEVFNPLRLLVEVENKVLVFDGMLHRNDGGLILELEPPMSSIERGELSFYHQVKASISKIKKAADFQEATEFIVKEIRRITGYDRVMIYRFELDGTGVVIAEDKQEGLEPYLDLHYPASDIPKQARKLYYDNWLRLIVDLNYQPVEIIPALNPLTNAPLDLSGSLLRSVSPIHREYCQNMGVGASICISLVNEKYLWGMIVCHHSSPKYIDSKTRYYCEFIGQLMSVYLVKKQNEAIERYHQQIQILQQQIKQEVSEHLQEIGQILQRNSQRLLDLVRATGAAISLGQELILIGKTPPRESVQNLLNWLINTYREEVVFTNNLSEIYPLAKDFKDTASGLLAISILLYQTSYHILWFRPEVIHTVNWGGNPNKPVVIESHGNVRLSPRKSFELWKETVREKSLPWQQVEIDAAQELKNTLMLAVLDFSHSALEAAAKQAEVANRAKSQFLAKMSHELRTPLNAILGFTQIMIRENTLPSQHLKNLEIINRSGEHLLALINDVLEMSKIEAGKVTLNEHRFDLHWVIESIKEMLQLKASAKGLKLVFEGLSDVPRYVVADEGKLRQVLINLLENAIKFTQNGNVTLHVRLGTRNWGQETGDKGEVSESDLQSTIQNPKSTIQNPQSLIFEIRDTGYGIATDELQTIFDPFVQASTGRQSMEGTGLGLPISQQFVRLMGGDILVTSIPGEGSIFRFNIRVSLPQKTDLLESSKPKRVITLQPNQPQYRILVVEDVEENRLLLVRLLESVGFEVRSAVNGVEAVAVWQQWQPHLICMDMLMPVMDGYEATKRIKATLKGQATVIIALTAHAFSEERSMVLEAGCDDFIPKPLREEILFEKIAIYLGVKYIYAEENQLNSHQLLSQPLHLAQDALKVMPLEWVKRLHWAAMAVDDVIVLNLIQEIPEEHSSLAQTLSRLVESFRLDIIANVTPAYVEENHDRD